MLGASLIATHSNRQVFAITRYMGHLHSGAQPVPPRRVSVRAGGDYEANLSQVISQ